MEFGMAPTFFGEGEELGEIEGPSDPINIVRRKLEVTEKVGFHFCGAIEAEFETNGCSAVSFLELFFDGEEEVVGFFFVDIEFAVSGDPGRPSAVDFHAWKNLGDEVADQFGKKDELSRVGAFPREGNQAGNAARNLDEGVSGRFLMAGL